MSKTIIVSNRLPVEVNIKKDEVEFIPSVGGLTTGLSSVHPKDRNLWVGWLGISEEEMPTDALKDEMMEEVIHRNFIAVGLTEEDLDNYYYGYSNNVIWPLFHYFTEYARFNQRLWKGYKKVNKKFAQEIMNYVQDSDTLWIHDYHLMLLPALLKKEKPLLNIGFFLHIPFPAFEVFRMLPTREEIIKGLLGANLIGFHTYDYQRHFLECVAELVPCEISCNEIIYHGHKTVVEVYPMGIDAEKFEEEAKKQQENTADDFSLQKELEDYARQHPEMKYILSIDRMDYTKGIVNRLKAFDYFLENYPDYKEKVKLLMLAVPSRTSVRQYQLLKKEIDEVVGRINSKYASVTWTPVLYMYRSLPFENLVELYAASDIALITPIRDGMNLVAKEYVMSRPNQDGVLILSEMAGAAKELTEALLINPVSFREISEAIHTAINMPVEEQTNRITAMQEKIRRSDVKQWANHFMNDLELRKHGNQDAFSALERVQLLSRKYRESKKRLLLLDYDGTLTGFKEKPEDAIPDTELLEILSALGNDERNEVYLISGRDKDSLGGWFQELPVNLVAEHGVFTKNAGASWINNAGSKSEWMDKIRALFEKFVAKVPKSLLEEKSHSLAWHYRMSDPATADKSAKELLRILKDWSADLNVQILNGNKVIEVTEASINKGTAVSAIAREDYDFILAIGDDHTDEFMFKQLPARAVSIKVGDADSVAFYRLRDFEEVRGFLRRMGRCG